MGRKRKVKKGGGKDEYQEFTETTVESKTTNNNQIQRNTMIDNQNSVNSTNRTRVIRQNLQKGGGASSKAEGVQEYYYPNFGGNSNAAMNAAAANNQLIAHAIMDDNITKVANRDSSTVKQTGGYASVGANGQEKVTTTATADMDETAINAAALSDQMESDAARNKQADMIQKADGSVEQTCPSCGGGRKIRKKRKTKRRKRKKSKRRKTKRRKRKNSRKRSKRKRSKRKRSKRR